MSTTPLLLVANPEPIHVGGHLLTAGAALGMDVRLADIREAYDAPAWRRRLHWWLLGRRPVHLRAFSHRVVVAARASGATCMLSTGIAPIDAEGVRTLGRLGVTRLSFLTDDPWNAEHRAPWFLDALREYDCVFSPRRANLGELAALSGPTVEYLPFAYGPDVHFPEVPVAAGDCARFEADLAFVGGADRDRVQALIPFIRAGFDIALYGGYWDRDRRTRPHARGVVSEHEIRKAVGGAKVSLCLVRRANRDGHSMRTFELAAMGACMLVEDTAEHRDLFGENGEAVVYFRSPAEALERLQLLLDDEPRRAVLSKRARALVESGRHTYAARLLHMVGSDRQAVA